MAETEKSPFLHRKPSLSDEERCVLTALLIDPQKKDSARTEQIDDDKGHLNEEMLFSTVPRLSINSKNIPKPRRRSTIGLWKAHEKGVNPQKLAQRGSLCLPEKITAKREVSSCNQSSGEGLACADEAASNQEVGVHDEESSNSSWEDHYENFDTWKLLEDEYAKDFGFDYHSTSSIDSILDGSDEAPSFQIIGTNANDPSVQPHVLSPPLMDSLATFLPERLEGENFWLKFSLVRDGASLDTFKRYVRAATYSIIAIETIDGQVFGSFTSSPWTNHYSFFGSAPAFVWKMRHSRRTKCFSLFDQAQLESEIDVFIYTGESDYVQVCRKNGIAVGGDDNVEALASLDDEVRPGFAFALDENLLYGTTSSTTTFKNPPLVGNSSDTSVFQVSGLEVWTFTPCMDEASAKQMEMTRFITQESSRRQVASRYGSGSNDIFSSTEIDSEKFYERVGQDKESESRRAMWQWTEAMTSTAKKGLGGSPRF